MRPPRWVVALVAAGAGLAVVLVVRGEVVQREAAHREAFAEHRSAGPREVDPAALAGYAATLPGVVSVDTGEPSGWVEGLPHGVVVHLDPAAGAEHVDEVGDQVVGWVLEHRDPGLEDVPVTVAVGTDAVDLSRDRATTAVRTALFRALVTDPTVGSSTLTGPWDPTVVVPPRAQVQAADGTDPQALADALAGLVAQVAPEVVVTVQEQPDG